MREIKDFVKFTKKEEKEIFACYYEARSKARMNSHITNLDFVRDNVIEGNNDMTAKVWDNFLKVLCELHVDIDKFLDTIKAHPKYIGQGNCYRIPPESTNKFEWMKAINKRREWRSSFRQVFAPIYDIDPNKVHEHRPKLQIVKDGGVG